MSDTQEKRVGTGSYVIAALGFLPVIGFIFAAITILLGFAKIRNGGKGLIALGSIAMAFTVAMFGILFYLNSVTQSNFLNATRHIRAKSMITDVARNVEYYKLIKGQYPDSLEELRASQGNSPVPIYDPGMAIQPATKHPPAFFYEVAPDKKHYYLLGVGDDQKPFTNDDIVPDLSEQERAKTGLLIMRPVHI